MRIAVDASRAFIDKKTGIEEYAFQLVNHLREDLKDHEVVLYLRKDGMRKLNDNLELPEKWSVKEISFKYFWTQIGMAWEFLINNPDVLLIPVHTIPWIHPQKSVVIIHGLEYEHCPESYSLYSRLFHRFFIKKSCKWASKVIAISKNTKKDLVGMYQVPEKKIDVVYNGFTEISKVVKKRAIKKTIKKYLLFLGRVEKRKNIEGIVKSFEILKEKHKYKGKLILAGKPGHGYQKIEKLIKKSKFKKDIILKGYVSDEERLSLMQGSELFMFPSFCEGFGLPILEAQSVKVPVVTSNIGPMNEVSNFKDILVNPNDPENIAEVANKILQDKKFRKTVIEKGNKNIERFSWRKCSKGVAKILLSQK